MRLLNLPDTETPNNEMIRPASAHVAMSAYLLHPLRKGGTLGQQRRTEVKHTHNYVLQHTITVIRIIISNRIATINCVFPLTYRLAPLLQVRDPLWSLRGGRKVETDINHMYMYTTTNTASRGGGDDHRHTVWLMCH